MCRHARACLTTLHLLRTQVSSKDSVPKALEVIMGAKVL